MATAKMSELQEKLSRVVELMTKKYLRETKKTVDSNSSTIYEYTKPIAIEVLRDLIDDYQMQTEMLIDEHYGTDVNQFKKMWYETSNQFEKQFSNILKNMSKPR